MQVGLEWTGTVFFSHYLAVLICMIYFMWVAQAFIYFLPTLQLAQILSVRVRSAPMPVALFRFQPPLPSRSGNDVFSSNPLRRPVHSRRLDERVVSERLTVNVSPMDYREHRADVTDA